MYKLKDEDEIAKVHFTAAQEFEDEIRRILERSNQTRAHMQSAFDLKRLCTFYYEQKGKQG